MIVRFKQNKDFVARTTIWESLDTSLGVYMQNPKKKKLVLTSIVGSRRQSGIWIVRSGSWIGRSMSRIIHVHHKKSLRQPRRHFVSRSILSERSYRIRQYRDSDCPIRRGLRVISQYRTDDPDTWISSIRSQTARDLKPWWYPLLCIFPYT